MNRKWDLFEIFRSIMIGLIGFAFGIYAINNYFANNVHILFLIAGILSIILGLISSLQIPKARK